MRPERRRVGDDDSSGVSSASSACVSVSSPPSPTVCSLQRRSEPDTGQDSDPAGDFSVFGEQLDLFTEILQTQQQLQRQCQQTTLDGCGAESTLFSVGDVTPTSADVSGSAVRLSPDVSCHTALPSADVARTECPPSSNVDLDVPDKSSDASHPVILVPPAEAAGAATPPVSRVTSDRSPTSPGVRRGSTSSEVTGSVTLPSADPGADPPPSSVGAAEHPSRSADGRWGLSWVWGQDSDEGREQPGGADTAAARPDADWSGDPHQPDGDDRRWTPGQRRPADRRRVWDSDQRLDLDREPTSEGDGRTGRSPDSRRHGVADSGSPVTASEAEVREEPDGPCDPLGEAEKPSQPQTPEESPDRSGSPARRAGELLELLQWVGERRSELQGLEAQPVTGNLLTLQRQEEAAQSFLDRLRRHEPTIRDALDTAGVPSRAPHLGGSEQNGTQAASACSRAVTLQDQWRQLLADAERHNGDLQSTLAKMHVLERCMQDVERRLTQLEEGSDDVISSDDVTGDRLLAVQRGLDDVNDQVARLTENGAPLSADRCSRVAALTSRLRQLSSAAGGGLAPLDMSHSVEPPWERAETADQVPYYLHHGERRTQWNHPRMVQLLSGLDQLDTVRFSAYRTALKLRRLQRTLLLHRLPLAEAALTFESEAWRLPCSGVAAVPDVLAVLTALYGRLQPPVAGGSSALPLRIDLCLNWLLSVYDSRRTGSIPVYCLKLAIATLSQAHLDEKYRYLFQLSADTGRRMDARRLSRLLRRLLQLPQQLAEAAAFGPEQVAPSVASCLSAAGQRPAEPAAAAAAAAAAADSVTEDELLAWLRAEPQSVVWLPVLHRVAGAESARHQARCNTCKLYPIVGFRYRCLKCFNWDMCQQCFFTGQVGKGHKLSHPLHEYCTESSSSDGLRDLARSIRNRFKSKHFFRKHPKLAYLPVQPGVEQKDTSPVDQAAPAAEGVQKPQWNGDAEPAEAANNSAVFSSPDSEQELQLITQYCLGLWPSGGSSEDGHEDGEATEEHLRAVIRHLEQEQRALRAEYRRLTGPGGPAGSGGGGADSPDTAALLNASFQTDDSRPGTPDWSEERSTDDDQLRGRMQLLDQQNRQLGQQLSQLRRLMNGGGTNLVRSSTLQTRAVTAVYLASDEPKQQPSSPGGKLSRTKRLALSLARRNGHTAEIMA